ncbi:MAG: DUF2391 family protein [bacterium]|nr:DUF2391 family protein [bacterium]
MNEHRETKQTDTKHEVFRIGGYLKEVVTFYDRAGNVLHKVVNPLMVEFKPGDFLQIIVGSTLLAVPVMFTEEVWILGQSLSLERIIAINILSMIFISLFVYYNFYRFQLRGSVSHFIKRIFFTYAASFAVVGVLMMIIGKAPWMTDWVLAYKRVVLVALPASMSAAVADMIK